MGIFGRLIGFGDGLTYSNSILNSFPDIVQGVSWFAGRPGIDFVLTLFATVIQELDCEVSSLLLSSRKPLLNDSIDDNVDIEEEQERNSLLHSKKPWFLLHPATYYTALLTALSMFGGVLINIRPGSFFQVAYPDYVPETIPVGCVIGSGGINEELQNNHDHWFNRTTKLVEVIF